MTDLEKNLEKRLGTVVNKYKITRYINSGAYGDVFEGQHLKTNELVALKIPVVNKEKNGLKYLLEEAKVYKHIANPENGVVNMKVVRDDETKIIVMDLLGDSLEVLFTRYKKFELQTIILLTMSMIDIIKHIHSYGYLHRDIKPDNFTIGHNNKNKLYCIDFGLSKKYTNRNNEHIKFSDKRHFCGTVRYASIAAHSNCSQSRKDDLESIIYILIYMFKGKLPWQDIKNKDKYEKRKIIGKLKKETTPESLCKDLPKEYLIFLKYIRSMDFDEKPHYNSLKTMFYNLYKSMNYPDNLYQWERTSSSQVGKAEFTKAH